MFMCPIKGCRTPKLTGNGGGPNSTTSDQPSGEVSPLYAVVQRKKKEERILPQFDTDREEIAFRTFSCEYG